MATINETAAVEIENQQPEQGGRGIVKREAGVREDKKSRISSSFSSRPGAANTRIAECLIGDETGTILFTARNDQVDLMKAGNSVIIRNAKIDMFKGSMRLAVDKWGRIEVTEPASFTVKEDNNLSLVEYELVNVAE
ncbi:unnamed protein product [Lactuca virosa]|uniref:Single-stranded DNA binding protein Ssb-like OB fold domain-containing protein n=1 Tax=Lactuca virosa TaxID=75947 RepID=A0AAU9M4N3_9ASTR|nr:unnamed protein product [Lactuca virosa]